MFPKSIARDLREIDNHIALLEGEMNDNLRKSTKTIKERKKPGFTAESPPTRDINSRNSKTSQILKKPSSTVSKGSYNLYHEEQQVNIKAATPEVGSTYGNCGCSKSGRESKPSKSENKLTWSQIFENNLRTRYSDDGSSRMSEREYGQKQRPRSPLIRKPIYSYTRQRPVTPESAMRHKDCFKETSPVDQTVVRERMLHASPKRDPPIVKPQTPTYIKFNKKHSHKNKMKLQDNEVVCPVGHVDKCTQCVSALRITCSIDTLDTLVKELKLVTGDDKRTKQVVYNIEKVLSKINEDAITGTDSKTEVDVFLEHEINMLKENYQQVCKENKRLVEENETKDRLFQSVSNKEQEFITLLTNMKEKIESLTQQRESDKKLVKEKNEIIKKLKDDVKVFDILKESHDQMEKQTKDCVVKNERLKNELRMKELEMQKYEVLLKEKDREINKLNCDLERFKREVEEQFERYKLRTNQVDVSKVMDEIMNETSKTNLTVCRSSWSNKLVHSSPTASQSGDGMEDSWEKISAIGQQHHQADRVDSVEDLYNSGYDGDSSRNSPNEIHEYLEKAAQMRTDSDMFHTCGGVLDNSGSKLLVFDDANITVTSSTYNSRTKHKTEQFNNKLVTGLGDIKRRMAQRAVEGADISLEC